MYMKKCCTCKKIKDYSFYTKEKARKDGLRPQCKECTSIAAKKKYARSSEYRQQQIDNAVQWNKANDKRRREIIALWDKNNQGIRTAHRAKRRAQKLKATPKWADLEYIKSYYRISQFLTKHTDEEYHIDHIVPLQGKNVCGLHCTENLQVVPDRKSVV